MTIETEPNTIRTNMKFFSRTIMAGLMTAALLAATSTPAQTTNKTPAKKKSEKKETGKDSEKKAAHPFHGKLAAVDKNAKTITVGKSVYQVTSATRIKKNGKDATLEDGVVGEEVSGYAKPMDDGKMAASSLTFGAKPEGKGPEKKKEKEKEKEAEKK
jgi:hypothetical protein